MPDFCFRFLIFIIENVKDMRKKRGYFLTATVVGLLLILSCSNKGDVYEMRISEKTIEVGADGGQAEIILYHTNDWIIDNREESWCSISPASGTGTGEPAGVALEITVNGNPDPHVRNNIVTIRSGSEARVFLVTQDAAGAE